jgi:DNA-directed RNA polymerase specialized sigma24 family protein
LILRFWEELDYEALAAVIGLSPPAARMRLKRARDAFRKRYEAELADEDTSAVARRAL